MKKKLGLSPVKAVLVALLAVGFVFGGVQTTRAALSIQSDYYVAEAQMQKIGINLVENGAVIPDGGALTLGLPGGEDFRYGKEYSEKLAVSVPGDSIKQYVRVIVTKYWKIDGKDGKLFEADMRQDTEGKSSIELGYTSGNGWSEKVTSASGERDILYYLSPVEPGGMTTPFTDTLRVNGELKLVDTKQTEEGTVYIFDGMEFVIKVEAQGVQTHNARDAMASSWGSEAVGIVNPEES